MEIWTPYGNQTAREFKILLVKVKSTGEQIEIKDFRFNKELHEVVGEKPKELTTNEQVKDVRDGLINELELKTRRELEDFGLSKGFTKNEMKVCLNKKTLVELLVSR